MSALPIVLRAESIEALVVGGGRVGTRRALALLASGARVRVVDPTPSERLAQKAREESRLHLEHRAYTSTDVDRATIVIAATGDRALNARVANDARAAHRLVNVADAPETGTFVTPAVHARDPLAVAVSAGGVPAAAARMRDAIADRFDVRYTDALTLLGGLRARLLANGDREAWARASAELIGEDFCESVERGRFAAKVAAWR